MQDSFFFFFAALTLLSSIMVIASRNPVNSAMFMIVAFCSTAGLFVILEAYFIATLQILVYAGAVMVLFLFVLMLLNVEQSTKRQMDGLSLLASIIGVTLLSFGVYYIFMQASPELLKTQTEAVTALPAYSQPLQFATSAKSFGLSLFTKYMLPVQVAGFLLLLGMVGVIVVSKKYSSTEKSLEQ